MAQRVATNIIQKRLYSAAVSPSHSASAAAVSEVQVDRASNGVLVASQQNQSSLARVVCAVKAGSRYEDAHQRGTAHCLRVIADQTQRETRAFRFVRELHQMGANFTVGSSREHLIYTLEVPKNHVKDALPFLTGAATNQSFRPWEISDSMPRLHYELLALTEQPDKRVVEKAHEAAYRQAGLGRSLYAPSFQLSEFVPDLLHEYVGQCFTPERISLSGIGVDSESLLHAAGLLRLNSSGRPAGNPAKYSGGEIREQSEDLLAYTILVGEGAGVTSSEVWVFAALEQLLGGGPQIKWASNTTSNKINSALAQKTQDPFNVQSFNVSYSDSGIFGISAVTVPENSEVVIKTAVEQLKELASKPVDDAALQGAKNRVKATLSFMEECPSDAVSSRAIELLNTGKVTDLSSTLKAIDGVTASAVQNAARRVVEGKLTMASVGEIHNVPYTDQL